ncbi:SRPBCC domain-containing protein [Edaphocola flava]|uniref:SRPBCC domain-containing protein n=1 Tax=Edaphocola flava TaxID=2499629 RepID=UPI00100C239F|nr:SRPBCC domain-containing protein [Edaphocola flava]
MHNPIHVEVRIPASLQQVWDAFTQPDAVQQWNAASEDWHCPEARNDLREGGDFKYVMAARDGSMQFDFGGTYTEVNPHKTIAYTMGDGRKVHVAFNEQGNDTVVSEHFEAEDINDRDMQQAGWQAILNNFKHYVVNQQP